MDREPIFVAGLSRCGKTLICSFLAAHPNIAVHSKQESNMWPFFYRQYGDLSQRDNFDRCLAALLRYRGVRMLNPDPDRIRKEFWEGEPTYARLFALFHDHYAEQSGKPRWGVQSVCVEYYAARILEAYPAAKMIHMIRDPRDRYVAHITTRRSRARQKVAIATANWRYSARLARRHRERYPQRYKVVRYESLVSQPQETMLDLFAFLDEDFAPVAPALESAQYKDRPISSAFVGQFRQVMSRREIASMQAHANQDMIAHDYELEPVRFSLTDYPAFYLCDQPVNLVQIMGWQIWKALQLRFPAQMGPSAAPHLRSS